MYIQICNWFKSYQKKQFVLYIKWNLKKVYKIVENANKYFRYYYNKNNSKMFNYNNNYNNN